MERLRTLFARLYNYFFPPLKPELSIEIRQVRPFFWMSIGGLVFLYGLSLYTQPHLRQPLTLAGFTLLMVVHGILHWHVPNIAFGGGNALAYILVQVGLAFSLCLVGDNLALSYGLFMGIIGECVGFFGLTPLGGLAVVLSLAGSATSYMIINHYQSPGVWALTALPITASVLLVVVMFQREATSRDKAQTLLHDLEIAHKQLAEYAEQVQELTLVAERQRMARELHDTLSQGLAGLILQLEAASAHLESQRSAKAQDVLANAMAQARETLAGARQVIGDLRQAPASPDLETAIRQEVAQFQATTGVAPDLEIAPPGQLSEQASTTMLRMVSECLHNTARYASARHVWVRLAPSGNVVYVEVGDDGAGFVPAQALNQPGHYGLLGMRERAALAGGKLEVSSTPGLGTVVRMELPVEG